MDDPPPTPVDAPAPAPGRVLGGRYRLERRIAAGGMASVWEGVDQVLARPVAIKVLHPHLAADGQFVARFRREAVAAARLAHPSIVSIYDTCSDIADDGVTEAIVMELVRGTTLRAELDRVGRFPPASAASIVALVADALAAAHAGGVVHRDVKPANVLLSTDGRVLVTDFGIAKAADGLDLTADHTTLGTAKYLAPEQVEGGAVDGRADVYAAGVILYELLCGAPPFVADTEAGTALARLHRDPPSPRLLCPDLPGALESVVLHALARDPQHRVPSAAALRDELRLAVDAGTVAVPALLAVPPTPAPPVAAPATTLAAPAGTTPLGGATPPPFDQDGGGPDATRADRRSLAGADHTPARVEPLAPDAAPVSAPKRSRPRRASTWVSAVVVLVAVGVAAGLAWQAGQGGEDDEPGRTPVTASPGTDAPVAAPAITGVATFDPPPGDGNERDDLREAAVDGDPGTAWTTEGYSTRDFGNLPKDGVGLVVTFDGTATGLTVRSPTTGWSAEVYVAAEPAEALEGWGEALSFDDVQGDLVVELPEGASGAVLVFVTDLGDAPSGNPSRFRVAIDEIELA